MSGDKMYKLRVVLINPKDSATPTAKYSGYENLGLTNLAASLREHNHYIS